MLQAFIIVLREAFEGFLIVAIILAYFRKSAERWLVPAVHWGILLSLVASGALGYLLKDGVNEALWEGVLGIVTVVMVGTLVIQMWRIGPRFKTDVEHRLFHVSSRKSRLVAFLGVLVFTTLMITREGMEMVVMLIQVRQQSQFVVGIALGLLGAVVISYAWLRFSYLVNLERFFKVTSIFLLLFLLQVAIYSIHEFSEAGVLPQSEAIHIATEQFSPAGVYGKWFSLSIVSVCALWLVGGWISDRFKTSFSVDEPS